MGVLVGEARRDPVRQGHHDMTLKLLRLGASATVLLMPSPAFNRALAGEDVTHVRQVP